MPTDQGHAAHPTADDWDEHWSRFGDSAAFNPAQGFRRDLILRMISQEGREVSRLIDIGSGQGDLAVDLQDRLPRTEILGIELSAAGVEMARRKAPRARFVQYDLLSAAGPPRECRAWAEVAVCSEVLEHVDDPVALLRNARPFLAPGCRLIVTVPGGPMSAFDKHIGHRTHYSPKTLRRVLEEAGFQVDFAGRAGFPFFNLYRLAVITRGASLVERAQTRSVGGLSRPEKLALRTFEALMRWNLGKGAWGWQIIASAHARPE